MRKTSVVGGLKKFLPLVLLASSSVHAVAQSAPAWKDGDKPKIEEWLAAFAAKQDRLTFPLSPALGGLGNTAGDLSSLTTLATGATTARTLAARAAQQMSVADFKQSSDPDDTLSFQRAVARALAQSTPASVFIPCGAYTVSGALGSAISGSHGIAIHGEDQACVSIIQTADADLFAFTMGSTGGSVATEGGLSITGIRAFMGASHSTTRKAFAISTSEGAGSAPIPVFFDHLTAVSTSSSAYWGYDFYESQVSDNVYLSHLNTLNYNNTSTVSLFIGGDTDYTAAVVVSDSQFAGGGVGIQIGNYWQGILISNVSSNAPVSLSAVPTAGVPMELSIINSSMTGLINIDGTAATISQLNINGNFLYSPASGQTSGPLVYIKNVSNFVSFTNNSVTCVTASCLNMTGVQLPTAMVASTFSQNRIAGFGTGLNISFSSYPALVQGNSFFQNTVDVVDTSTPATMYVNNGWSNNTITSFGGGPFTGLSFYGSRTGSNFTFGLLSNQTVSGAAPSVGMILSPLGLPNVDFDFRTNSGTRTLFTLQDNGQSTGSYCHPNVRESGPLSYGPLLFTDCPGVPIIFSSPLALKPVTVASLPACNSNISGSEMFVTDSSSAVGATLAGGGSITALAICNGTNWSAVTGPSATFSGNVTAASYTVSGPPPTISGSCSPSAAVGNTYAAQFTLGAACTGQTVTATFPSGATNGWTCQARNNTTSNTTSLRYTSTTTVTFFPNGSAGDVISFGCSKY